MKAIKLEYFEKKKPKKQNLKYLSVNNNPINKNKLIFNEIYFVIFIWLFAKLCKKVKDVQLDIKFQTSGDYFQVCDLVSSR